MVDKTEFEKALGELSQDKKEIASIILDDLIFIENQLHVLRKKPFLKYNPDFPDISKTTPEARLYKELLGQKNNLIRTLNNTLRNVSDQDDTNPMDEFNRAFKEKFG